MCMLEGRKKIKKRKEKEKDNFRKAFLSEKYGFRVTPPVLYAHVMIDFSWLKKNAQKGVWKIYKSISDEL